MMEMWKWNLAFQCVVNIGVRGSENVRTRVVEADMVPVIATILDNYITVVEDCREKAEAGQLRRRRNASSLQANSSSPNDRNRGTGARQTPQHYQSGRNERSTSLRRHNPPPAIEIPNSLSPAMIQQHQTFVEASETAMSEGSEIPPRLSSASPVRIPNQSQHQPQQHHYHHHHHHRSQDMRQNVSPSVTGGTRHISMQSLPAAMSLGPHEDTGLRPVRDVDRLPSMVPPLQNGITSQPDSPTTPSAPSIQSILQPTANPLRPPLRQQSMSGDSDDNDANEVASEASALIENHDDPMVDVQNSVDIRESEDQDTILDDVSVAATLQNESEDREAETFNITHQSANDGSIITANVTPNNNNIGFNPVAQPIDGAVPQQGIQQSGQARYLLDRSAPPGMLAATPRDEDVLMSLQLLAYVSKYCNLRSYFQRSHLVPKLKLKEDCESPDESPVESCKVSSCSEPEDSDEDEEYLLPDDFNIFPLVEKFTVRHHSQDMQHWAGVVMRNLCRKDDARGGIRQCAYYECGRWEQWTRQFAKCRRCRRTKYCSKECQKNAWVFHRHWCQVATP